MKVLIDHCLPRRLKQDFLAHEAMTTEECGWETLKNGELLRVTTEAGFQVFITADQNLRYQQNTGSLKIAVLVLIARRNTYAYLQGCLPAAHEALKTIAPGQIIEIKST